MRKALTVGVLFLVLLSFDCALGMMPGSARANGIGKESFYTNESVYFMHMGSFFCNSGSYVGDFKAYVVNNKNWSSGDSIGTYVAVLNGTLNSNGKMSSPIEWSNPSAGKFDVIFDLNKDGVYSESSTCIDFVDGQFGLGFEVIAAAGQNSAIANNTNVLENGTSVVSNGSLDSNTSPKSQLSFDWMSVIIIGIGLLIALLIIGVTIIRLR